MAGIDPDFSIINSLFTLSASTPPMPPPWLAPHHLGTRRNLQLTEHRREHRAEQRREQLLVQRIEQPRNQVEVEVEVQVRIRVAVQVEMERKTRLTMQVSTQPALLPPELPDEQRAVPRKTQARLRRGFPGTGCQFAVAGVLWRAEPRPRFRALGLRQAGESGVDEKELRPKEEPDQRA